MFLNLYIYYIMKFRSFVKFFEKRERRRAQFSYPLHGRGGAVLLRQTETFMRCPLRFVKPWLLCGEVSLYMEDTARWCSGSGRSTPRGESWPWLIDAANRGAEETQADGYCEARAQLVETTR